MSHLETSFDEDFQLISPNDIKEAALRRRLSRSRHSRSQRRYKHWRKSPSDRSDSGGMSHRDVTMSEALSGDPHDRSQREKTPVDEGIDLVPHSINTVVCESRPKVAGSYDEMLELLFTKHYLIEAGSYHSFDHDLKSRYQVFEAEHANRAFAAKQYPLCRAIALHLVMSNGLSDPIKARTHLLLAKAELGDDIQTRSLHADFAVRYWKDIVDGYTSSKLPLAQARRELAMARAVQNETTALRVAEDVLLNIDEAMADVGIDVSSPTSPEPPEGRIARGAKIHALRYLHEIPEVPRATDTIYEHLQPPMLAKAFGSRSPG